jgi:hypothetical protein
MTNFLIQFLSLPREDTKRFEILNLISSLLEWNDEQRQKVGLAQSSGSPVDVPTSPPFAKSAGGSAPGTTPGTPTPSGKR